jgi:hypothetical protein
MTSTQNPIATTDTITLEMTHYTMIAKTDRSDVVHFVSNDRPTRYSIPACGQIEL